MEHGLSTLGRTGNVVLNLRPIRSSDGDDPFSCGEALYAKASLGRCASDNRLELLKKTQREDAVLKKVLGYVEGGWPAYLPADEVLLRPYFENRDKIVVVDDILVYGDRLVIPSVDRFDILKLIHQGHLGITKCRERARTAVWWPGMSSQIADMVRSCVSCRKISNVVREPLIRSDFPNRPWERVGSDLFFLEGKWYLLVVDYFSRYVEVDLLSELSSLEVVSRLRSIFARHGIPEMLISDNGPQYSSEAFSEFTRTYNFVHVTSSPKHPQSNGAAERAV